MCFAFTTSVILDYLFSAAEGLEDVRELSCSDIGRFVGVLESEILSHGGSDVRYRYVYVDLSGFDDGLSELRDRFLDFGDYVMFVGRHDDDVATRIEGRYGDEVVIGALRSARDAVRGRGAMQS